MRREEPPVRAAALIWRVDGQRYLPGDPMGDAVGPHNHQLSSWGTMPDAKGEGDNQVLRTGFGGNTPTSDVLNRTSSETRPKTFMVNSYIRIN